jgi:hypothetical protein
LNKFKSIEKRTNKIYTRVCKRSPTVVGQPFFAIGPIRPLNNELVTLYVYGLTTKRKINAEKRVISHFLKLESGPAI